jgi:RNA-directed DNA polymerase
VEDQYGFATRIRARTSENAVLRLYSIARTVLEWHIKVRGEANPYDPTYTEYFERRRCFAWRVDSRENLTGTID